MKNTLGKIYTIFFFCMFFTISLLGNTQLATYKLTTNKKSVHIKEPLLITFTARQKDHSDNMFFSFNIQKSPNYKMKLLHKTIQDHGYHNTITTFEYILFALKEKPFQVNFDFTIRTASDKAVKQSYVDDHDDSIAISTNDTKIKINPLIVKINKLKKNVDLVGDFRLHSQIDTMQIDQYGAVNVHYILTGKGYKEAHVNILNKTIKNVTTFSKIKDNSAKLTQKGYIIDTQYIYALTAKEDFTIPAVSLKVYSPTKDKYYTLHTEPFAIKVNKIDTTQLIDKTDSPTPTDFINTQKIKEFFIYAMIFFSGFFTAKLIPKVFLKNNKKVEFEDIKNAKSAKELLRVLIIHYQDKGLDEYIFKLEDSMNKKQALKLTRIKKEILSVSA